MLVLSRKSGERIQIGEDITVEIRRVAGSRVTVAIAAPRDVRILRGELERVANEFRDESPRADKSKAVAESKEPNSVVLAEAQLSDVSQLQNC